MSPRQYRNMVSQDRTSGLVLGLVSGEPSGDKLTVMHATNALSL